MWDRTNLIEFPAGGIASAPGKVFVFLVDEDDDLLSKRGFLFFESAAWACSSRKLCGVVLRGVATDSCASGL